MLHEYHMLSLYRFHYYQLSVSILKVKVRHRRDWFAIYIPSWADIMLTSFSLIHHPIKLYISREHSRLDVVLFKQQSVYMLYSSLKSEAFGWHVFPFFLRLLFSSFHFFYSRQPYDHGGTNSILQSQWMILNSPFVYTWQGAVTWISLLGKTKYMEQLQCEGIAHNLICHSP